jgi:hypothetical protein
MAVFGINYEGEGQDLMYKSVDISYDDLKKVKIFDSGNFVKDWFDLVKFVILELSKTESHFIGSSSVDHFFMDGAKFDAGYLVDKVMKYDGYYEDGIEIFVPEGTQPTWAELKEICK